MISAAVESNKTPRIMRLPICLWKTCKHFEVFLHEDPHAGPYTAQLSRVSSSQSFIGDRVSNHCLSQSVDTHVQRHVVLVENLRDR